MQDSLENAWRGTIHSKCGSAKRVQLELLRAGPLHNQLLSPLTQYLAVCGDAGASIVNIPYEHAEFEERLESLIRCVTSKGGARERENIMTQTGRELANILGMVPALIGEFTWVPWVPRSQLHNC